MSEEKPKRVRKKKLEEEISQDEGGYPKYKYHEEKEPVVVFSIDEELELGSEWANSPADFE